MLASPLIPNPFSTRQNSEDASQYRPVKDLEAFNSLLPAPIEFVEGSSTGALAVPEGKYEPINGSPKITKSESRHVDRTPPSHTKSPSISLAPPSPRKCASLYPGAIESSWPDKYIVGAGLVNTGNTCFLNSALQCLLHTPPLLHVLAAHTKDECHVKTGFCMACGLRQVALESHSKRTFNPWLIVSKLQTIAKHMRRGRQEDSHEFLRYAIDALQKSCLAGYPAKMDPKLAETTWVHRIFGGRLRSRVTCSDCGHHSDTFDRILDLSLDIYGVSGLKEALRKFVTIDYLKGADKYKCEKCKKAVIAEKQFTLHDAPMVLTVHFKRFSPLGRKIGHHVNYDDRISLKSVMSEGQHGPTYSLYGVICHAGGGPNSGHYIAHVKGRNAWYEMNDDMVSSNRSPPTGLKSAYMLFYLRDKGQALDAALSSSSFKPPIPLKGPNVMAAMKRRRVIMSDDEDQEDTGVKEAQPFIGPQLPVPSTVTPNLRTTPDPQAVQLKKKIEATKKPQEALLGLSQYADSDDDEDTPQDSIKLNGAEPSASMATDSSPPIPPPSSPLGPTPVISPTNFYGSLTTKKLDHDKKRKSPDGEVDSQTHNPSSFYPKSNTPASPLSFSSRRSVDGTNPFNRMRGGSKIGSRLNNQTYGNRKKKRMGI